MQLSIQIKKTIQGSSTLTVKRPDGTTTFSKLNVGFEIHDIVHYVVEKRLNLKKSFYGMLAQGYGIQDFQLSNEKRPEALQPKNMAKEALVTEHLVNLLTIDYLSTENQMNLYDSLETILKDKGLPFPQNLNVEGLVSIQGELADWMNKWNGLENGQVLTMELEL